MTYFHDRLLAVGGSRRFGISRAKRRLPPAAKSAALLSLALAVSPIAAEVTQEKTDDGYVATFKLDATEWEQPPERVNLAGSFNGWNGGTTAMSDPDADGVWTAEVPLKAGQYEYKFVVDGERWLTDPTDDEELRVGDNYGGFNSGVVIGPDIRKAPPPEENAINAEFVRHDPATDAVQVDLDVYRLRVYTQQGDVEKILVQPTPYMRPDEGFPEPTLMKRIASERGLDVFEAEVDLSSTVLSTDQVEEREDVLGGTAHYRVEPGLAYYRFLVVDGDTRTVLNRDAPGSKVGSHPFSVEPQAFDVPEWAADAVWYQIFPERFRNANPDNDPGVFDYEHLVGWNTDWWTVLEGETPPDETSDNFYTGTGDVWARRYGGDLQGVREKLPYLRELGVTAIYFNPIFEAESMHKYDTADFRHVDDNFGVVAHHGEHGDTEAGGELSYPPSFGEETDDPATWVWSPSDQVFLDFTQEAHAQGFKVVIDGVFNHVGTAHPFFQDVLEKGKESRYADWFEITDWGDPENWGKPETVGQPGGIQYVAWDKPNGALPAFKKDAELGLAPGPREHIFNITKRWLDPDGDPSTDDGIDGWRLDVPGDIPHPFWKDWRKVVKETKPDAYITGEIWQWADPWLQGDEFDAVMNYQFAMPTQDFFVDEETALSVSEFNERLLEVVNRYPRPITYAQQNLMGSHDTDRLASMFVNPDRPYDGANRPQDNAQHFDGPMYSERKPDAEEWRRMIQLVNFQHAFVGAPMTYYGDEAGMWAPDDPSNRQPFPWPDQGPYEGSSDGFDQQIFDAFQRAIAVRNSVEALRVGDFEPALTDDAANVYAFKREHDGQVAYVVLNRSGETRQIKLPVAEGTYVDYLDPTQAAVMFEQGSATARPRVEPMIDGHAATDGTLSGELPAWGTAILVRQ